MSIVATRFDEYRLPYVQSNLDMHLHRMSMYGAYETFKQDTANLIPGYQNLINERASELRTVSIPVINRKDTYNATTARSCSAYTGESTSAYVTPSWTTYVDGFSMYKSQYYNNYIDYQTDFNKKLKDVVRLALVALDTAGYTHLNTNRTTTNAAEDNPYSVVANSMIVPAADNDMFFNELGSIMQANDFEMEGINIVGSPRLGALVREYTAQGVANSENRVFQFGGYNFKYSNRVTISSSAYRDTLFATPEASLGFLSWVDQDSRNNHTTGDGKEWSTQFIPELGIDVGVLYSDTCSDLSSSIGTGYEATKSESYQISFDYSFVSAYNSSTATLATPIFKADFVK